MPAASRSPTSAWAVPGARGTWLSKTKVRMPHLPRSARSCQSRRHKGKPVPVTVTEVDAATGAVTVTFDSDPSAYKVVPVSQFGAGGPLQPAAPPGCPPRRAPDSSVSPGDVLAAAAAGAAKRRSPLEAAAAAVAGGRAAPEAGRAGGRSEERERERKRRRREQELAAEAAERERVGKLEELRRWREGEAEREREAVREKERQAEEERRRVEEQARKAEERRLRREARELEAKEQLREDEEWAKFKEQARRAEAEQRLPAWAALGASCTYTSPALKKQLAVTITGVDQMKGVVTVTFDSDPSAFKVLQAAQLTDDGPLRPKGRPTARAGGQHG